MKRERRVGFGSSSSLDRPVGTNEQEQGTDPNMLKRESIRRDRAVRMNVLDETSDESPGISSPRMFSTSIFTPKSPFRSSLGRGVKHLFSFNISPETNDEMNHTDDESVVFSDEEDDVAVDEQENGIQLRRGGLSTDGEHLLQSFDLKETQSHATRSLAACLRDVRDLLDPIKAVGKDYGGLRWSGGSRARDGRIFFAPCNGHRVILPELISAAIINKLLPF